MLKKLLLSLALAGALFAQHDAAVNLNSDDIELQGNIDLGELNQSDYADTYFLTLGFLDVDNDDASTDPLWSAGFKLRQDVEALEGLRVGLGFKGVYTEVSGDTFTAIPLGLEAAYTLPLDFAMPIIVSGSLDYAPSVLAFSNADKYMEKRLEVSIQIIEQANVFLGYRDIDTDYEDGDFEYTDTNWYVGFRVRF